MPVMRHSSDRYRLELDIGSENTLTLRPLSAKKLFKPEWASRDLSPCQSSICSECLQYA